MPTMEYRSLQVVLAEQVTERREFKVGDTTYVALPGEWIVWDGGGDEHGNETPWICPNSVFVESYDSENPTESLGTAEL